MRPAMELTRRRTLFVLALAVIQLSADQSTRGGAGPDRLGPLRLERCRPISILWHSYGQSRKARCKRPGLKSDGSPSPAIKHAATENPRQGGGSANDMTGPMISQDKTTWPGDLPPL